MIALLAAARDGSGLASLTVVEPPATRVALDVPEVAAFARGGEELWANGPRDDPEAFMRAFLASVGSDFDPPVPLPPQLLQGARLLVDERGPWEADIPLEALAARGLPTLVVSGGTILRSRRSATASSSSSTPSASCCRASATTRSSTRGSTACSSTSSPATIPLLTMPEPTREPTGKPK